jgi:hypothetical protein
MYLIDREIIMDKNTKLVKDILGTVFFVKNGKLHLASDHKLTRYVEIKGPLTKQGEETLKECYNV